MSTEDTITLPRRAHRQPSPSIVRGGDCGACVLGGLLGLPVPDVYPRYGREGRTDTIDWWAMRDALHAARSRGLLDRIVTAIPTWPWESTPGVLAWGPLGTDHAQGWWGYLRMAIDAGYYGLTHVDHARRGPHGGGPNHWVLLCGARYVVSEIPAGEVGARIRQEVLVSCSASCPEGEWVDLHELLRERGAYEVMLARPAGAP